MCIIVKYFFIESIFVKLYIETAVMETASHPVVSGIGPPHAHPHPTPPSLLSPLLTYTINNFKIYTYYYFCLN